MYPQTATRELTLKEITTEDLTARLEALTTGWRHSPENLSGSTMDIEMRIEIDAIEAELQERSEYEQKVSRW